MERVNLRKSVIGPIIRGMILKISLVQKVTLNNSVTTNAVYRHRRGV